MAESELPTEEELREALDRVGVVGHPPERAVGGRVDRLPPRLARRRAISTQARLAIEALRALEPVLREGGVDEAVVRDLEQARANLQLAYATAVAEAAQDTSR